MEELLSLLRFGGVMTTFRAASGIAIVILLVLSSFADIKTKKIPAFCSYSIMLIAMALFAVERKYLLIPFFILSVLGTGSMPVRIAALFFAVVLTANYGEWLLPFVIGLILGDIFFAAGIIGGGDAQLFFGMMAYAYNGWGMLIIVGCCTIISGLCAVLVRKTGFFSTGRMKEMLANMSKGTVKDDLSREQIPFAVVLTVSAIIYNAVQFL